MYPSLYRSNNLLTFSETKKLMTLEHIAIWTKDLETLKAFYETWFAATSSEKYSNPTTGFQSYFLRFRSGARLELMYRPDIPGNRNDTVTLQHLGLIHLAFGAASMHEVDACAERMKQAGISILRGPRKTGDGYYEFETLDPDNNRLEVATLFVEA